MAHKITAEEFEQYASHVWYAYAGSVTEEKSFKVRCGKSHFRVFHGKELVCDTFSLSHAIEAYNSITTKPTNEPKLDN